MARRWYSKDHYQRLAGYPDEPGQAEWRARDYARRDQAHREMVEKFGALTPENALAAVQWMEARIKELRALAGEPS